MAGVPGSAQVGIVLDSKEHHVIACERDLVLGQVPLLLCLSHVSLLLYMRHASLLLVLRNVYLLLSLRQVPLDPPSTPALTPGPPPHA